MGKRWGFCASEASRYKVTINYCNAEHEKRPLVYGDAVLLEQVLINLLRNAADANWSVHPNQDSMVDINVKALMRNGCLFVLRIRGQGSPDESDKLYTVLYQQTGWTWAWVIDESNNRGRFWRQS
ncbi:hypothetical protein P4S64_17925 [Vibrio sp. M60_M31a]